MKKILLTGSSSGFGFLAAKTLAAKGHTVYATMRNINGSNASNARALRDWAKTSDAKLEVVELDVTSDASAQAAIKTILASSGGTIDVLINNAGISFIGLSETLTTEQSNQLFQVNTIGTDRMIRAVLPTMHKQGSGLIINVSSVQARQMIPTFTVYNATKAAVDALSVGYYYELRSSGIDVAIIQPGGYPTTDIVTKGIQPANPGAEKFYGADMIKVKNSLNHYFTPTETSPSPQPVADKMLELVDAKQGERALWSLVGAGPLEAYIDQINQTTKTIGDLLVSNLTA
jgi:NAD(P)-dependent dehydrogenase (short-subunit alcohol dehydrogenase family)